MGRRVGKRVGWRWDGEEVHGEKMASKKRLDGMPAGRVKLEILSYAPLGIRY